MTTAGPEVREPAAWLDVRSAGDLASLQARRAHVDSLAGAANVCAHGLDVGVPATGRPAVRVRDRVAEARALAADVAVGSHGRLLAVWMCARRLCAQGGTHRGQPQQDTQSAPTIPNPAAFMGTLPVGRLPFDDEGGRR